MKVVFFRVFAFILVLVFSILVFFALKPIRIGLLFSPDTPFGREAELAIFSYVRQHPRIGLHSIRLLTEEPKLLKRSIQESYRKLLKKKVDFIIGGAVPQVSDILFSESLKNQTLTFALVSHRRNEQRLQHYFHSFFSLDDPIHFSEYYLSRSSGKLLKIFSFMKPFSEKAPFENENHRQKKVVFKNLEQISEAIRLFRPDFILLNLSAFEMIQIMEFLKEKNLHYPLFTYDLNYEYLRESFFTRSTEGMFVFSSFGEMKQDEKEFLDHFKSDYRFFSTTVSRSVFLMMKRLYAEANQTMPLFLFKKSADFFHFQESNAKNFIYVYQIVRGKKSFISKSLDFHFSGSGR